ncbi:Uncharacterized protein OBRU01_13167 [Operophtera brumata]|uniref:Ommochrome-binding protein n=1 Tax=Operophtera brumata TaxID=104452 RepID=A0A0L7L941_OPEBR|nr:Uncharacterized protein OBRU01_13167 [Operophtera brumata]
MNLTTLVLASILATVACHNCHACFDGVCYSKTRIMDEHRFSGQLAIDRTENIVYFHYEDSKSTDHTAGFDLDDIKFKVIPNIDFSFARAVDQKTRDVYIGGAQGIYKYNPIENVTSQFGLFANTIWHMQFKNKIYYTIFKTKGLFTIDNNTSKAVLLSDYTIDDFIIDHREDIYFVSQGKIYRLKKGGNSATLFANDIYSLAIDKDEVAHFVHSGKRGLYKLDETSDDLIEIGAFASGVPLKSVFDNGNNLIYHEIITKKLYYLTPNFGRCLVSYKTRRINKNPWKTFIKSEDNEITSTYLIIEVLPDDNDRKYE